MPFSVVDHMDSVGVALNVTKFGVFCSFVWRVSGGGLGGGARA